MFTLNLFIKFGELVSELKPESNQLQTIQYTEFLILPFFKYLLPALPTKMHTRPLQKKYEHVTAVIC